MEVRFAREDELDRVNELRAQVGELHAAGKPDMFKPGFPQQMRDFLYTYWSDPEWRIVAAEQTGTVCGFAVLHLVHRPESPGKRARDQLDIAEFGVDQAFRRQGVARGLMDFIVAFAKANAIRHVELNVWEFNQGALAFYEAVGFSTYRRDMEMTL